MKKLYAFAAATAIGAFSYVANAQETEYTVLQDLTSKVVNFDFKADQPIDRLVRTYSKDMLDAGLGAGDEEIYGQQPVTGWTATRPSDNIKNDPSAVGGDACASAVFAYQQESADAPTAQLGGAFYAPYDYDCEYNTGNALGAVGVWGGTVQYTQDITLAPGAYMIRIPVCNTSGSNALAKNLNGFITADGKEYLCTTTAYTVSTPVYDEVVFVLNEETAGKLSIGYQGANVGSAASPHMFYDAVYLYQIDPTPLIKAEIDAAKVNLLEVIEEAVQLGVDASAADAVYQNENATMEEVLKAIEDQKALNAAGVTDLSEFFIRNPHFNIGTPVEGGICTYDYDMSKNSVGNFGMQPVGSWVATNPSDNTLGASNRPENGRASGLFALGGDAFLGGAGFVTPAALSDGSTEGNLLGFISVWTAKSQYTQGVTLPAGKYTLTISYYNAGGTGEITENLMGFIPADGEAYLATEKKFVEKQWNKMKVYFELEEETTGEFSVGYTAANAGSGSMPHLFIDGIAINYVGEATFDPSLAALNAAINAGSEIVDLDYYVELQEKLQAAIETAEELSASKTGTKEENVAAADAINELIPMVNANIAAYSKLEEFLNSFDETVEAYADNTLMEPLYTRLSELRDNAGDAVAEHTWSTQQINEAIASVPGMIKEETQNAWDKVVASGEKLDEPFDITSLLSGLAYTYSTSAQSAANVPDKEWAYGDASNFKTQYGTAEVWNQSPFKVTRTLTDMPAGTYTITTKAFYRTADNATNYDNYTNGDTADKAFVFAGNAKKGLTNVALLASDNSDAAYTNPAEVSGGLLVPNNQQTAHDVFENADYAEKVTTSVQTVLPKGGDLNFGICADQMDGNSWVVWYSFEIAYNAVNVELMDTEISGLIAEAEALLENETVAVNAKAMANLDAAILAGNDAIGTNFDTKNAALEGLASAIAYANTGITTFNKLQDLAAEYTTILEETTVAGNAEELADYLASATASEYESNEQMQSYIDGIPAQWVKFVLSQDMTQASAENPIDITPAILNADFSAENANYWTITPADAEAPVGQNQGYQKARYENADNGVAIEKFIEVWRQGAVLNDGIVAQQIKSALPAGYYTLSVDAYAVNQTAVPEGGVTGVYLVAINGNDTVKTSICADATGAVPATSTIEFRADGTNLTTVGILVEGANANWAAADNFKLSYVGSSVPDGIIGNFIQNVIAKIVGIYSIDGQKLDKVRKGINIIKMSDGTTQKLYVE